MSDNEVDRALGAREWIASRGVQPLEFICAATMLGALLATIARAPAALLFLGATFGALIVLRNLELPRGFELSFAVGIVLQGWGNALLLFERIAWYDKAVHFMTPLLIVPPLYLLLTRAGALPSLSAGGLRRKTLGVLVVTIAIGIALAAIWEVVEGTSDRLLGTNLALGYLETIDDLYASVLGSIAAGIVLAWSTMPGREIPGLESELASIDPLPDRE